MKVTVTYEIIEHDPPRRTRFEGVNGPVRVVGRCQRRTAGRRSTVPADS
jgi:hypothetical protein